MDGGRHGLRRALVAAAFALALTLLAGGGLAVRRFIALASVDLGFQSEHRGGANDGTPASLQQNIAAAVQSLDADLPIANVKSMDQIVSEAIAAIASTTAPPPRIPRSPWLPSPSRCSARRSSPVCAGAPGRIGRSDGGAPKGVI